MLVSFFSFFVSFFFHNCIEKPQNLFLRIQLRVCYFKTFALLFTRVLKCGQIKTSRWGRDYYQGLIEKLTFYLESRLKWDQNYPQGTRANALVNPTPAPRAPFSRGYANLRQRRFVLVPTIFVFQV